MFFFKFQGSICYATALRKANLVTPEEEVLLKSGLHKIMEEWKTESFLIHSQDEDIHSAHERRLKVILFQ